MEENKNIIPSDLPALETFKRNPDGRIDPEPVATGKTEKGFYIVPDNIFDAYYKELPAGTVNQSKTWRATTSGGKIRILGGDPEADKAIHRAGAEALNASKAQRRTFAEVIEEMLVKPANKQTIEDLELKEGSTNLDAIIAAALKQSARGNVKAMDFLRDTIGQKPADNVNANITGLTAEDKEMLQRVQARLDAAE